ncbi:MAG: orotidine 5'-phosphate decarboxylase [Promethearchaeati archaeon SRVP18_Atabeyarchaeia-1]
MSKRPTSFKEVMEASSLSRGTRVVLALDISARLPKDGMEKVRNELLNKASSTLDAANKHIAALKINHQLVLPLGLYDMMQVIIKKAKKYGLPLIMDCKANDVEHTNRWIALHYFDAGFDAIIANPFVGWEGGIEPIMSESKVEGKGVILLTYMSHKGATEGYGQRVLTADSAKPRPQYMLFAEKAVKWGADGVVVGATYPERIREVHEVTKGRVPIYSPGIGAQGGEIDAAFKAGCEYAIIGRSIYESDSPENAAAEIKDKINGVLSKLK